MLNCEKKYSAYCRILRSELVVALGCTEPISIAYAAAKAREVLGSLPNFVNVEVCGNIIKNTKSVIVPNTNGLKGINTAAAAGVLFGNADKKLEVLSQISQEDSQKVKAFANSKNILVAASTNPKIFFIKVTVQNTNGEEASVTIEDSHTNITQITLNGKMVFENNNCDKTDCRDDYLLLNVADIVDFADTVELKDVEDVLERQIALNSNISNEGLKNDWGARIGKILASKKRLNNLTGCSGKNSELDSKIVAREGVDNRSKATIINAQIEDQGCDCNLAEDANDTNIDIDISLRAMAAAAAGSDARMSGCEMPVVIVSGSGNQGMTASLPVITYAKYQKASHQTLLRALVVSNLMTIHQKTGIGKLSAYCGAVSAGVGAACGVAYLNGGRFNAIAHTAVNALAIGSGIVCDGAKPSCAGKIATAVFVGLLGYKMYLWGQEFVGGDGIVKIGVDNTIANIGRLASEGMKETDKEIIKLMTE